MVKKILASIVFPLLGAILSASLFAQTKESDRQLFVTADQCMACHNGLVTPSGEDVSIGFSWRSSMMANASRDPYWQGAVRREVIDHPQAREAIEEKCSTCHMPMAHFQAKAASLRSDVFSHLPIGEVDDYDDRLAADGTSCTMCHQISEEGLGTETSFTGGFRVDTTLELGQRKVFGPYEIDAGRQRIMRSASGFQPSLGWHVEGSEFCATCHTLYTHALGPDGKVVGELPEQVPYLEWRHSAYLDNQPCQSCHMRKISGEMSIASVLGEVREGFSQHSFRGGNFLMPRIFNRHRQELAVVALPQELELMARQTREHLSREAARISISSAEIAASRLEASLSIENLAGHKLPTAYPSRRVWIRFSVRDNAGKLIFESGGFEEDGSIRGNDNDHDFRSYERHYQKIDSADEVQIYEAIMTDHQGEVTTGLLAGVRYAKDNRLLPRGFDKETADPDIAVRGQASSDADFMAQGDRIDYRVDLGQARGPFSITAELWYQPVSYRWAQNFASYDAPEPKRFLSFYESVASSSATILARTERSVRR